MVFLAIFLWCAVGGITAAWCWRAVFNEPIDLFSLIVSMLGGPTAALAHIINWILYRK
jgi:hypothetical protein